MLWAAGGEYNETSLLELSTEELRHGMTVNFESNFCMLFRGSKWSKIQVFM